VTEVTQETMHLSCAIVETFVESRKFSPPHVYLWPVLGVGISPRSLAPENCCRRRCSCDKIFSHSDRTPACFPQTDERTYKHS